MPKDALELIRELLREREPKLLTLEEVLAYEGRSEIIKVEYMACEKFTQMAFVRGTGGEGSGKYVEFAGIMSSYIMLLKDYGKTWQCWRM